jgi:excisionase family DNA binding protein
MDGRGGGEVCSPSDDPEPREVGPPCRPIRFQRPTSGPQGPTRGRPLTLPEAAAYLNVAERYMRRLVTDRRIPYFKVGRLLRFSAEDLDAFLEASRIEPGSPHPLLVPRHGR